ncbi:MAG: GIY-YIG nuclease family protein [Patescibacteria group bacterium]
MYFVYLLTCADGSIYTGIATDVKRRFAEHRKGTASRYTRAKKAVKIIYTEKHLNRSTASKREAEIKKWPRRAKLALAAKRKTKRRMKV